MFGLVVQFGAHYEQGGLMKALQIYEVHLKGIAVCCEDHPTLGTEPQNILTEGMYFVIASVGAVGANAWKRQFRTSAT